LLINNREKEQGYRTVDIWGVKVTQSFNRSDVQPVSGGAAGGALAFGLYFPESIVSERTAPTSWFTVTFLAVGRWTSVLCIVIIVKKGQAPRTGHAIRIDARALPSGSRREGRQSLGRYGAPREHVAVVPLHECRSHMPWVCETRGKTSATAAQPPLGR
jgi:hypothetical protein